MPARRRACIVRQTDVYELSLRREAEALRDSGYEVDVLCMRSPDRSNTSVIDGVRVIGLPTSRTKGSTLRYLVDYGAFLAVATVVLAYRHVRRRYAFVQVNTMPDALVFAALVPKLMGAGVLAFMKEPVPELADTLYGKPKLRKILERVEQAALRFAHEAITVTPELRDRYVERGADGSRIDVVLNCPDPSDLLAPPTPVPRDTDPDPDDFTLVCHGSIEDRYGHDTIIDAIALLAERRPGVSVVITGRGSAVAEMCEHRDRLGLGERVRYEGWVTQERLAELLTTSQAGIVAQKASPYSHLVHTNKMVDYWVFGLPVIASRLDATQNLFDESVIEYFEPGDPASLAEAIDRVLVPTRWHELSVNGTRAQAAHGWGIQREVYLAVCERVAR